MTPLADDPKAVEAVARAVASGQAVLRAISSALAPPQPDARDARIAALEGDNARLRAVIAAAKKRAGDIKGVHTRWTYGQDLRPIAEVMSEIEHITYSVVCYCDGIPGQYLDAALATPPADAVPGMVLVPREPTEVMLKHGAAAVRDYYSKPGLYPRTRAVWAAMVAAAERDGGV